jgi:hypothetical protein
MNTTVAVDLTKNAFQLAVADASWKVIESRNAFALACSSIRLFPPALPLPI